VRQLMKRLEFLAAQGGAVAYVLVKRDREEYGRIMDDAEVAMKTIIHPIRDYDRDFDAVYVALDDPGADWSKAVAAMLNGGAIQFVGKEAMERLRFMEELERR